MPSASDSIALALEGVDKQFGGIQALAGVHLELPAGAVTALVGENGAGKSTAVKIMTGVYRPDRGWVRVSGQRVELGSTQEARRRGIAAVYQEPALFDELSVAENIYMGQLPRRRGGWLDWAALRERARALLSSLDTALEPDMPLGAASVAEKHRVAIARALAHEARVLILDEPTAALSSREVDDLNRIIRRLARGGAAILFISHKLDEVFAIADRFAVFRDGRTVAAGAIGEVDEPELIRAMVGRSLAQTFPKTTVELGAPVLEVRELGRAGEFADISFTLHRGEVLGFYGLVGSGRSELMETLFGLARPTHGVVSIEGQPLGRSPRESIERGLVLVPEDRVASGVIGPLSIRENMTLPSLRRLARGLFLDTRAETRLAADMVERLSIKCASLGQAVRELSGGNQQKVVIAKWLATEPKVIILDEPTQGIDVAAKAAVHAFVGELVARGLAVILVSSELPEVMGIADRIVVMRAGRIARVLSRAQFEARAIARAALGSADAAPLEPSLEPPHREPEHAKSVPAS